MDEPFLWAWDVKGVGFEDAKQRCASAAEERALGTSEVYNTPNGELVAYLRGPSTTALLAAATDVGIDGWGWVVRPRGATHSGEERVSAE